MLFTNAYLSMTNVTRDILIETGRLGMVWATAKSGYTDMDARRVAIYHVDGALKSMNFMYYNVSQLLLYFNELFMNFFTLSIFF